MDETTRTDALVDRYWDELLELEPTLGTSVGDERYDDRLPDPSEAGRAASEAVHRAALAERDRDRPRRPRRDDARATLDVVEAIARRFLAGLEHRTDRLSFANHLWGPAQALGEIASIPAGRHARAARSLRGAAARLPRVPRRRGPRSGATGSRRA